MRPITLLPLALSVLSVSGLGQSFRVLHDVNAVPTGLSGNPRASRTDTRNPEPFLASGRVWYFVANGATTGFELYRTDGTPAGTVLVKDIRPGPASSNISHLVGPADGGSGTIWFVADDGRHGVELWTSDGTANGTRMVADQIQGPAGIRISSICVLGGSVPKVFLSRSDSAVGTELWVVEGGTIRLVKDIEPGTSGSFPRELVQLGDRIYFRAATKLTGSELWQSDGTEAGTKLVTEIVPGTGSSSPGDLRVFGSKLIFRAYEPTHGSELWESDGTAAGTKLLADIEKGAVGSFPRLRDAALMGGRLYFQATTPEAGSELWRTDGTESGTTLVADIETGRAGSRPRFFAAAGNVVFFQASTAANGFELWVTDGSPTGTRLVADLSNGSYNPTHIASFAPGKVAFWRLTGGRFAPRSHLYVSDGTAAGTVALDAEGGRSPEPVTAIGGGKFLAGVDVQTDGLELYECSGTKASLRLVKDLDPRRGSLSANVAGLTSVFGSGMIFAADGGTGAGHEPHQLVDGKLTQIADLFPGTGSSRAGYFTPVWTGSKALTFFSAYDAAHGQELWVTDGTATGTKRLTDIYPGATGSDPRDLVAFRGRVYFYARSDRPAFELWSSDGTVAGTKRVGNANVIATNSALVVCGDRLFFIGTDHRGWELWVTDGTAAGTRITKDIQPGGAGSNASRLTAGFDKETGKPTLFFTASSPGTGLELWKSDGTADGTKLVEDIASGGASSSPSALAFVAGKLYFHANDQSHGVELWCTDGTSNGTKLVHDLAAGGDSSYPTGMTGTSDGRVFFVAQLRTIGAELFVTDGTSAGTRLVRDLVPGTGRSAPEQLTAIGNRVYFTALRVDGYGRVVDRNLWVSDGSEAGTREVKSIDPGVSGSAPILLTRLGGKLVFVARDVRFGQELFVVDEPGASVEEIAVDPSFGAARMTATAPVLGKSARVRSSVGGAGKLGLVWMGRTAKPYRLPLAQRGIALVDLASLALVATTVQTDTSFALPIPNDAALASVAVTLQTWWLTLPNVAPVEMSNAVVLGLGAQ